MDKKKLLYLLSTLILMLVVVFWFSLPAVIYRETLISLDFMFHDATFGKVVTTLGIEVEVFQFSFMNLLGLIALALSLIINFLLVAEIKITGSTKNDNLLALVLTLVAAIFPLFVIVLSNTGDLDKSNFELGYGVFAVFALILVSAAVSGYSLLTNTKSKK